MPLLDVRRSPDPVNKQHLAVLLDVAAPDVSVVLLHCLYRLFECQAVLDEALGVDPNLVLLLVTSPAVDFGHPLDSPQFRPDDPVLDGPELHQFLYPLLFRQRRKVVSPAGHDVVQDLTQACCRRTQRWMREACWQFDSAQTLIDKLAGKVNVRSIGECDHHLGQAEL